MRLRRRRARGVRRRGTNCTRSFRAIGRQPSLADATLRRVAGQPLVQLAPREAREQRRDLRRAAGAQAGVAQLDERLVQLGLRRTAGWARRACCQDDRDLARRRVGERAATSAAVPRTTSSWSLVSSRHTTRRRSGSRAASVTSVFGRRPGASNAISGTPQPSAASRRAFRPLAGPWQEADEGEAVAFDARRRERRGHCRRARVSPRSRHLRQPPPGRVACRGRTRRACPHR